MQRQKINLQPLASVDYIERQVANVL